jgi:hypothetical protein
MRQEGKKLDSHSVLFEGSMRRSHLNSLLREADDIRSDRLKKERLEKSECKICFYVTGRIGGSAMTQRPCGICGKDEWYGSTCTDALCINCAKEHELCKYCGADRELRERRRNFKWINDAITPISGTSNNSD